MFGPMTIVYVPPATCELNWTSSVQLSGQVKPVISDMRSPDGPVKLTTSSATAKLDVSIGSSKLN